MLTLWLSLGKFASAAWLWVKTGNHWKLVVAAMTAAIIILLVLSYRASLQETAALKDDLIVARGETALLEQARVSDDTAVATTVAAKADIAKTEAEQRIETDKALKANPDWANQPIPTDIVRSLRL